MPMAAPYTRGALSTLNRGEENGRPAPGSVEADVARGLALRMDHGSQ